MKRYKVTVSIIGSRYLGTMVAEDKKEISKRVRKEGLSFEGISGDCIDILDLDVDEVQVEEVLETECDPTAGKDESGNHDPVLTSIVKDYFRWALDPKENKKCFCEEMEEEYQRRLRHPLYQSQSMIMDEKTKMIIEITRNKMKSEKDFDKYCMENYSNARK